MAFLGFLEERFFIFMDQLMFRSGYVTIVGEPNVGKSTLLNALIGQKLSIVTRKPQTTRQRILGILTKENYQIIFLDTPGLIKPKYLLHQEMIRHAESALNDADVILVLIQAAHDGELAKEVSDRINCWSKKKTLFLVINKIDKVDEKQLNLMVQSFSKYDIFEHIIPISALKHKNLDVLLSSIISNLPIHNAYYPDDIVSEYPERFFVAEIIRENIFERYRDEIPYSTAVEIREFTERKDKKTFINADIIVERDSQKGILIGKRGVALKDIGTYARKDIEKFLQHEIYLELHIKVRNKWRDNKTMLRQFGYTSESQL